MVTFTINFVIFFNHIELPLFPRRKSYINKKIKVLRKIIKILKTLTYIDLNRVVNIYISCKF